MDMQMTNTQKYVQHPLAIKDMQIKITMRNHYMPLKRIKYNLVTTQNAGKDVEKLYHSYIVHSNIKYYSHSGKQFGSFSKKEIFIYHENHQLHSWAFIQTNKNASPYKNLNTNVYSSFNYNSFKLEIVKMFFHN
jgi:hypothetical protein